MNPLREYALRLLTRRDYTRAELRKKLSAGMKAHSEIDYDYLETLLNELVARNLLSDTRYAERRASARANRYGNIRLAQELKSQGVAPEIVAEALTHVDNESIRARAILLRKFGTLPANIVDRAKQARYLMNRGFSSESVYHTLREQPETTEE